ncbi:MAG: hypothetical protein JF589_05755 [Gemmatimonadetes bacterium]|nr:hypothetical protein [Gemmatimonadota bacterium]
MAGLAKKVRTLRRVAQRYGMSGVRSAIRDRVNPFTQPVVDYAKLLPAAVVLLARHGKPARFFNAVGAGIGDDLLLTSVFHELRRRGRNNFWVRTTRPELYQHNEDVPVVVPPLERFDKLVKRVGTSVVYPWYTSYHPAFDRDDPTPEQHLISIMCQKAGITGTVTLRPYLHLTDEEKRLGVRAPRQVAIMSSGLDAKHAMRNKNWSLEKYQGVVSALRDRYDFVQVGSRNDPSLDGVLDLRGKTSLRETAAVLHRSLAFVGQVGFLMHLARAVDCRAVIVYGGRETPSQSGYRCNENLYSAVHCSPCWRLNTCPYHRMCLERIDVHHVVDALERQVARAGTTLEVDTDTITDELIVRNAARYEQAVEAHKFAWAALYE